MGEDLVQRVYTAAKRGFKFLAGAQCVNLAKLHDRYAVAITRSLFQIMGGQENGDIFLPADGLQILPQICPADRIESGGRFIQK